MAIKDIIENENMHKLKLNDKYVYCNLWYNRKIHWFIHISLTLKGLANDDDRCTFKEAMYFSNKHKYNCLFKIFMESPTTNSYRINNFNRGCRKLYSFRRGLYE